MVFISQKQIQSFNEIEYGVYNFILKNSTKIPYMTIRELAGETHVSTSTLLRFCKKVGCNGFTEFKVRYKMELSKKSAFPMRVDVGAIQNFLQCASSPDFIKELEEIAGVLYESKILIFVGFGNSGAMAQYAARYFSSVGKFALHIDNPMYEFHLDEASDYTFIFLSVSGEALLNRNILANLKRAGVPTVSITNDKSSPLAKLSDYNISYYIQYEGKHSDDESLRVDTTSQFPVIYILETLAKRISAIKGRR